MAYISYDDLGNVSIKGIGKNPFNMIQTNNMKTINDMNKISKTNLYLRGLPSYYTEESLKDMVADKMKIKSVKIAKDDDGKCKGYGFIDFINKEAADEAKHYMEINYSTFPVKYAKENEKDRTNLYISNLPHEWTTNDSDKLKELFENYGRVQSAFIMLEKTTNQPTGVGFVRFSREEEAELAISTLKERPKILPGCNLPIEVKFADKHSPESRKRRNQLLEPTNNTNLNSTVSLQSSSSNSINRIPLLQAPPPTPQQKPELQQLFSQQTNSFGLWENAKLNPFLMSSNYLPQPPATSSTNGLIPPTYYPMNLFSLYNLPYGQNNKSHSPNSIISENIINTNTIPHMNNLNVTNFPTTPYLDNFSFIPPPQNSTDDSSLLTHLHNTTGSLQNNLAMVSNPQLINNTNTNTNHQSMLFSTPFYNSC